MKRRGTLIVLLAPEGSSPYWSSQPWSDRMPLTWAPGWGRLMGRESSLHLSPARKVSGLKSETRCLGLGIGQSLPTPSQLDKLRVQSVGPER